jgi:hypothetical protein
VEYRTVFSDFGIVGYHNTVEAMGQIRRGSKGGSEISVGSHGRIMKRVCPLDVIQPEQISQRASLFRIHHNPAVAPVFFVVIPLNPFSKKTLQR